MCVQPVIPPLFPSSYLYRLLDYELTSFQTEFISENKLKEHIQNPRVERKQEQIKLVEEVKRPENAPVKKKWIFFTPTYHPYRRNHFRQSSIAPSVGQPESRQTSVAVDYATWGFGGGMTPTTMPTYGQAATNTVGCLAPASKPSAPAFGNSTPYPQYNLPSPPPSNSRATPEQLSAQLLARLQQVQTITPQELSESMQKHFSGLPIYARLDPRFSVLFKNTQTTTKLNPPVSTSQAAAPSFDALPDTLNPSLVNNAQTKTILDPALITQQPQGASAMTFVAYGVAPYTSLPPTRTHIGPLAPQPLLQFQNAQCAPSAHHGLHQGQIQEYLAQVEQNSPFRDPFPGEVFHPEGWVVSAMNRLGRYGNDACGRGDSAAAPPSQRNAFVAASEAREQSGDGEDVVLESIEHDDEDEEEQAGGEEDLGNAETDEESE